MLIPSSKSASWTTVSAVIVTLRLSCSSVVLPSAVRKLGLPDTAGSVERVRFGKRVSSVAGWRRCRSLPALGRRCTRSGRHEGVRIG